MTDRVVIRSYQRIFRPSRRIYRVEGHQIPVPGGIPLAWLGYFTASLLTILALTAGSLALNATLAAAAALYGRAVGGTTAAATAGGTVFAATTVVGVGLGLLDWPLRLLVLPAAAATLATQATPDGRPVHRYARSWIALHLRVERRSLGRPLPPNGGPPRRASVWIARDHHREALTHGRIVGPATVSFRAPVAVTTGRFRTNQRRARPAGSPVEVRVDDVELGPKERLEVRP